MLALCLALARSLPYHVRVVVLGGDHQEGTAAAVARLRCAARPPLALGLGLRRQRLEPLLQSAYVARLRAHASTHTHTHTQGARCK